MRGKNKMKNKELFEKLEHFEAAWWASTDYRVKGEDNGDLEDFASRLIRKFIEGFREYMEGGK